MIKRDKSILLFQIIAIALLFALFFLKINNIFLLLGLISTYIFIRKYKKINKESKDTIVFTIVFLTISITLYYLLGLINSYESNYASIFYNYMKKSEIIINILIVLISELIRPIVLNKIYKKEKININIILFIIIYILIDMKISVKTQSFSSIKQFYILLGMVILPSLSKNMLLNYLTKNKKTESSITYRLINDLYIYLLPIIPVMNMYYESIIFIVFPYLYYTVYSMFFVKHSIKESKKIKSISNRVLNLVYILIFLLITAVVSGCFKYSMLSIGSESMKGTIDKGDAIVLHKIDSKKLEKGQIIAFEKDGTIFVHRIVEKFSDDHGTMFITKGDANRTKDMWVVYEKDIKGVYDFKIKYIGYPSVWLSEIF